MPTPVQTLWIVTAATLPTVGLVVLLTPKAPTLLSAESIQPAVVPHAESLLNQRNLAIAQSLPPKVKPPASKAELALKKPSTALSRQAGIIPSRASSKAFHPTTQSSVRSQTAQTLPSQSVAAQTPPSVTPRQVSEASSRVVPFRNPKPQPISPSKSVAQIPPPQRLRQQPIVRTTPFSSKTSSTPVVPSPQPSITASPAPSVESSPEREPSREEVESLCKKFPMNSRCQNNTVARGESSPTSSNAPSAQASPEREPSKEEVESLCQKFPMNSRCRNNTVARGASSSTSSNAPRTQTSPEREPSREEVESLCQKFPMNSRCQNNTTPPSP